MSAPSPHVARAVPCAFQLGDGSCGNATWRCNGCMHDCDDARCEGCNGDGTRWDVTDEPAVSIPDLIAWLDKMADFDETCDEDRGAKDAFRAVREHLEGLT